MDNMDDAMDSESYEGEEIVELEFTEEDRLMAEEIANAKNWLQTLSVSDVINKKFFDEASVEAMRAEFLQNKPFPHISVENFVDSEYQSQVLDEIKNLDFRAKSNDLYHFTQSVDLKSVTTPLISKLRDVLYSSEMCGAMARISGIEELYGLEYDSKPDLFSAVYSDTDRLLCHDDELEGRRIAFILYLVGEDWEEKDGGHLDLFESDSVGNPSLIGKALLPRWGTFSFFEVSEASYHQVREVLSDKNRISIGGWFHGPPMPRKVHVSEPLVTTEPFTKLDSAAEEIEFWLNKQYRKPAILRQAAAHFGENSSIELHEFLRKPKYDELLKELQDLFTSSMNPKNTNMPAVSNYPLDGKALQFVGPVNLRCYYKYIMENLPETSLLRRFVLFMQSNAFERLLREVTTCTFSSISTEARCFSPGCYTLSFDDNKENKQEGLDIYFTLFNENTNWDEEWGGSVHYTKEGEDEELLTCYPHPNTLSLVYRGEPGEDGNGVLQFTRYIDHRSTSNQYQLSGVARLSNDDDEELLKAAESKKKKKVVKKATK